MANFTVTNLFDAGMGSFRQSVLNANATSGADIINFDSSLTGGTISLTSGGIEITDSLSINGLDREQLTIAQGFNDTSLGHFLLSSDSSYNSNLEVFINNLTITGKAGSSISGILVEAEEFTINDSIISEFGGVGIDQFYGNLTVNNSVISGNGSTGVRIGFSVTTKINNSTISDNQGIGIEVDTFGNVSVNNSIISSNSGSGISSYDAFLNITNTTIADNQGAGIFGSNSSIEVQSSTISGNTRDGIRGSDFVEVINSTISSNSGQGINLRRSFYDPNVTLQNSTITGNTEGGILVRNDSYRYAPSPVRITNTIIANSINGGDCTLVGDVEVLTNINSLIENGSCGALLSGDPNLGPLQNNGGPTQTHALLPGSIAIDAGFNGAIRPGITTDQRGFPRIINGTVDIGAYEAVPEPLTLLGAATAAIIGTAFKRKLGKKRKRKKKDE